MITMNVVTSDVRGVLRKVLHLLCMPQANGIKLNDEITMVHDIIYHYFDARAS